MRKVMLLIPALLLVGLSGCGENISSNNNGESISTSDSASTNKEWSNEIKDLMNEYLKGVLPYHQFDETTFKYEIDAENGIIVLYDELLTNHISGYKDVLISNGWSLDEEMEVMAYSSYDEDEEGNLTNITGEFTFQEAVFSNENNGITVTYSFSDNDGIYDGGDGYYYEINKGNQLVAYLDSSSKGELTAWPADLIASYFNGAVVPAVNGVEKYFVDDSEMETYGLVISVESDDETIVDTYKQTLIDNEFTVNYDNSQEWYVAVDKDKLVDVAFYFGINEFTIQIFAHEEIAENVLDFSSETLITDSNSDKAVWENGNYKMIVTKATSASNVGNGTYLSNPLRLYVGQHVELSWGEESVSTIEINLASANNKSSLSTISSLTGGSISINENVAIITVSEGASKVEFDIVKNGDFKQCHISSIVFNA